MMWLILLTIFLSAALTALIFNYVGTSVFSQLKAQEIAPRAKYVADLTADYMQGKITQVSYARAVGSNYRIWDASLYVYDAHGHLFVYPKDNNANQSNIEATKLLLPSILEGQSLYNTEGGAANAGVVLGDPVFSDDGEVIGAVFMMKPISEVTTAIRSLTYSLLITMLAVLVLMIFPAYWGSNKIVKPILQMTRAADAMALGDFSVRATDTGTGEIAQLGKAFNYLSGALSQNIEELTFERNRLRATLFGLQEGIVAVNAQGGVAQYNPSAVRLMGGNDDTAFSSLPVYESLKALTDSVLKSGETATSETPYEDTTLRMTATPLVDDNGKTEGVVAMIQDITEAIRLEQTRRDYVANVSHELRTPLASIRSLADALNDGLVKKDEDKARYYGYILHESVRLSRLIDDLLELSRLQSGGVALHKRNFSVEEMVLDVADRYAASAAERGEKIELSMPDPCPMTYSNPDRAEQVLIALLDNAIKHAAPNAHIRVGVTDEPTLVRLAVSNDGSIAKSDVSHLFERFYKADHAHSGGGTGLGLAIAKEIMELLHEQIGVTSENGQVVFSFTLHKQ